MTHMHIFLSFVHNLVKEICQVRCCMLIVDCVCVSDVSDVSDVAVLKLKAGRPAMQCCIFGLEDLCYVRLVEILQLLKAKAFM